MNFNQNDVITLKTVYGVGTGQIIVNGLMNSTGTKFLTDPNTYSNTYITVNSGGQIKGIGNTFAPTVMTFNNGSILNDGDLMGNNFANTILILPATYAPLIVNNENLQFGEVDLLGGTLGAGQSLNLGSVGSLTTATLFYKFIGNYTINTDALLTIGSGVKVTLNGITLTANGTLNFNQNDVITLKTVYGVGTGQIIVNGLMNSTGTEFLTDPNTYSNTYITINSGGQIVAVGSSFAPTQLILNPGAKGSLTISMFTTQLKVDSTAQVTISGNNFSPLLGKTGQVVASGNANDHIDMKNNYWGTLDPKAIDIVISDHNDNLALPTIDYIPFIGSTSGITTATLQSVPYSPAAQTVTLTATVTGPAPINEGTVTFRIFSGPTLIGKETQSATVSKGTATVSYNLPAGLAAGTYTVQAQYSGTGLYLPSVVTSADAAHALTVTQGFPSVNFLANPVMATYTSKADQSIPIHLVISTAGGPVNEGTVTLTQTGGPTQLAPNSRTFQVVNGAVDNAIALPAGSPAGAYTFSISFNGSVNYRSNTGTPLTLNVNAAPTTLGVAVMITSTSYSTATQPVAVSAVLTSDAGVVGGGTVTFTLLNTATNQQVGGFSATATVASGAASTVLNLPAGLAAGSYRVVAAFGGTANYATATNSTATLTITKVAPVITWAKPAAVGSGTALGSGQLNAAANVPGKFVYTPAEGTVVQAGLNQVLSVTFTPSDLTNYSVTTATTTIDVLATSAVTLAVTPASGRVLARQPVTLTAALVLSDGGNGTGSVEFLSGVESLGTVVLDATGHASLTTSSLAVGMRSISARYSGNSTTIASVSQPITIYVSAGVRDDFDNDGKTDLGVFNPASATFSVRNSSTGSLTTQLVGATGDIPLPGNYAGVGKTSFATYNPSTATFSIVDPTTGVVTTKLFGKVGDVPLNADYDGDGVTDFAVYDPSTFTFSYLNGSSKKQVDVPFGSVGDIPLTGDFDGDGKTDIAIFHTANAVFYILNSSTGTTDGFAFGGVGDIPVPGDYNGDGKTDIAIFRPSTAVYYVFNSTPSAAAAASTKVGLDVYQFGAAGDLAVPGDYDGDGRTDFAIYRPSTATFFVLNSGGAEPLIVNLGTVGDIPLLKSGRKAVVNDFDGDGKSDPVVITPARATATFLIPKSSETSLTTIAWGGPQDTPVRGDFDGDGRADVAVYRASTGIFYIKDSSTGGNDFRSFGGRG